MAQTYDKKTAGGSSLAKSQKAAMVKGAVAGATASGVGSMKKTATPRNSGATVTKTNRSTGQATTKSKTLTPTTKAGFSGSGNYNKTAKPRTTAKMSKTLTPRKKND